MMTVTIQLDAMIAAYGLSSPCMQLPAAPLGEAEWLAVLNRVRTQRIGGFLVQAIADGSFAATPGQWEQAMEVHAVARRHTLLLEAAMIEVTDFLDEAGIEYRVLKGPAFARLVYPEPGQRSYGDIDLLVSPQQFDRTVALLIERNYFRPMREHRAGFERRFGKGANLVTPDGCPLDLHRTLVGGPLGQVIDPADLFATPSEFSVAGKRLPALGAEQSFLHCCLEAVLEDSPPRLVSLRDIAQVLLANDFDVERMLRLGAAWRAKAVAAEAVRTAWSTLRLTDTQRMEWLASIRQENSDRRLVSTYRASRGNPAVLPIATFRAIPSLRAKTAYAWALILPDRRFLNGRHSGHLQRWWHAARTVVALITSTWRSRSGSPP